MPGYKVNAEIEFEIWIDEESDKYRAESIAEYLLSDFQHSVHRNVFEDYEGKGDVEIDVDYNIKDAKEVENVA